MSINIWDVIIFYIILIKNSDGWLEKHLDITKDYYLSASRF